jgi:hypothetical protein
MTTEQQKGNVTVWLWALLLANVATIGTAAFVWEVASPGPFAFGFVKMTRGIATYPGVLSILGAIGGILTAVSLQRGYQGFRKGLVWTTCTLQGIALASVVVWILTREGDSSRPGYLTEARPAAWVAAATLVTSLLLIGFLASERSRSEVLTPDQSHAGGAGRLSQ